MAYPDIFHIRQFERYQVSRDVRRGHLTKLGSGLYTTHTETDPVDLVRRRWADVVAALFPGAVVSHRSALEGGPAEDGAVFITVETDRQRPADIQVSGLTVRPLPGSGPLDDDMPFLHGIRMTGPARACLENLQPSRSRKTVSRTVGREGVETYLDRWLRRYEDGEGRLNALRDRANELAPFLGLQKEAETLSRTIGAMLGSRQAGLRSDVARARSQGKAYDPERLELFERVGDFLDGLAPGEAPEPALSETGRAHLAFFEAYFSNFIEGTEFEVGEAYDVIFSGHAPADRPADAHDIRGTFAVAADPREMSHVPQTADELVVQLREWHATVMLGRPEVGPGEFKTRANVAGSTTFVAPDLVQGTLERGFDYWRRLADPFARGVMAMFVVSEVHPFADGNGRVARLAMNAELTAGAQGRAMIPICYRNNYLQALKTASRGENLDALPRTLAFGQRWTRSVFTPETADHLDVLRELAKVTNALQDPVQADHDGVRLQLPQADEIENALEIARPASGLT